MAEVEKKLTHQEGLKKDSLYLAGDIAKEMADSSTGAVSDDTYDLLKFHGSYFGYNRDTATVRKKAGLEKEWEFMVRMVAPGGRLSADQYLALDGLAEKYANGTMKITTRETFQFHCIVKENMKKHIAGINKLLLTTLGGCGDVVRNVMCTSAPIADKKHEKILADAREIAAFCKPKTSAYHEIWLDGENVARSPETKDYEPLYGETYLPRKFKIAVTIPEDNSMDVYSHDLAFIQIWEGEELKGYNVLIGGGLGMSHNRPETYARAATNIMFVKPDELLKATESVVKLVRDHGDRTNRKHARLKYVVQENGLDWTRARLAEYMGRELTEPHAMPALQVPDHMGWHPQGDGKWFLGVPVDGGRIGDFAYGNYRTGFYALVEKYRPQVILTADQSIIFANLDSEKKAEIEALLKQHHIKQRAEISHVHRHFLACVALPTCGLALAEAERVQYEMVQTVEKALDKHGLLEERISVRVTGCPNGCARPYLGDIGLVGRTPGHYALFIGGDFEGTRLNTKILDRFPYENIADVLNVLFAEFVANRKQGEGFGNFAHRVGEKTLAEKIEATLGGEHKWAKAC